MNRWSHRLLAAAAGLLSSYLFAQKPAVQQQGTTNQASGTNSGVMNQGPCNVTVINPKDSVLKITGCSFAGLSAQQQATQLKQLLTMARQNGVTLERIEAAVTKIVAEGKPSTVQQSVDEGVANSGTISAPLTFNDNRQYARPNAPPNVSLLQSGPVDGHSMPLARPEGLTDNQWTMLQGKANHESFGEEALTQNPGYQFLVGVERTFPNPEFLIICDHPCRGTVAYLYHGPDIEALESGMGAPSNDFLRDPRNPNVTLLQVSAPPTLTPGRYLVVKIRSLDSQPISATIRSYAEPIR